MNYFNPSIELMTEKTYYRLGRQLLLIVTTAFYLKRITSLLIESTMLKMFLFLLKVKYILFLVELLKMVMNKKSETMKFHNIFILFRTRR